MSKYNDEMSKLHFTDEGKKNLMKNVKETASQNKVKSIRKLSKMSVAVACVCLISATAFATGILEPVSDILAPIFGGTAAQTEIIDKIGVPVGASDTDEGITITVEAIMGSKNHVAIVYKLSNEDGSRIVLPEDADQTYLMPIGGFSGTDFKINGGMTGSLASQMGEDGYFRLIERKSSDTELPNGKNVTATFENLSYFDANGENTIFADGKWKIKYEFSYEDMTTEIPVNQTFERQDLAFYIEQINISPISLDVVYTVNSVPSFMDRPVDGEITDNTERELYAGEIELLITKTDGTILDMTNSGGGLKNKETYVIGNKGGVLDEIVPLDEISSITVGEIEVFLD